MNLKELFSLMGLTIDDTKEEQFKKYTKLLTDYNNKVNLTSILDPDEINLKHYLDSVLPVLSGFFKDGMSVIDVGCGAGFPSVPLKIYNPSLKFTLLDSLNKRINFLNILIEELGLTDISTFHSRAEDAGHMENYRQKYDICVARAVAPLNVLMEYCTPFVKCDGYFIALKGKDGDIELDNAMKALASSWVSDSRWPPAPTSPGRFNVRESLDDMYLANEYIAKAMEKGNISEKRGLYSPQLMKTQIKAIDDLLMSKEYFGE